MVWALDKYLQGLVTGRFYWSFWTWYWQQIFKVPRIELMVLYSNLTSYCRFILLPICPADLWNADFLSWSVSVVNFCYILFYFLPHVIWVLINSFHVINEKSRFLSKKWEDIYKKKKSTSRKIIFLNVMPPSPSFHDTILMMLVSMDLIYKERYISRGCG